MKSHNREYIKDSKCYHVHTRTVMMYKTVINFKKEKWLIYLSQETENILESINKMRNMKYWEHIKWNIATATEKNHKNAEYAILASRL